MECGSHAAAFAWSKNAVNELGQRMREWRPGVTNEWPSANIA
jgi:hypothetical protein